MHVSEPVSPRAVHVGMLHASRLRLIVISHQEKIIEMADQIMIVDDGVIKRMGSKEEVLPYLNGVKKCHECADRMEGKF